MKIELQIFCSLCCTVVHFVLLGAAVVSYEPEFLEPLKNVTVTEGREATFTCVVDHLGGYRVAWIKADTKAILAIHNKVITHNNRMSVIHSDHKTWELKIRDVKRNDSGQYMCQINTDPMKMQVGYLNVVIPPDIISDETSGDVMVPEGSSVRLICSARGFPDPRIEWRREDGKPLVLRPAGQPRNEIMIWEGPELILEKVARDDMGAYMCIASNDIPPAVSKRTVLQVHFHPLVRIPNQLVGAPEGTNITLECEVEASPKSINYWTKVTDDQGPQIVDSRKYINEETVKNRYTIHMKLTIKVLEHDDFTSYKCTAKNSLGEVEGTIKLYEIEVPKPPTTLTPELPLDALDPENFPPEKQDFTWDVPSPRSPDVPPRKKGSAQRQETLDTSPAPTSRSRNPFSIFQGPQEIGDSSSGDVWQGDQLLFCLAVTLLLVNIHCRV